MWRISIAPRWPAKCRTRPQPRRLSARRSRLNPDFAPAYINLGRIHEQAGAADQAVELWRTAVSRPAPVSASAIQYATTALTQIARVMGASQQGEAAEDAVRQCLEINPRQTDIIEQYTALRLAQCKWPIATSSEFLDRKVLLEGTNPLSMAVYTDDPLLQLASAYRYVKRSSWDGPHDGQNDRRHADIDLSGRRPRVLAIFRPICAITPSAI